jgi:hypothetical protein
MKPSRKIVSLPRDVNFGASSKGVVASLQGQGISTSSKETLSNLKPFSQCFKVDKVHPNVGLSRLNIGSFLG